MAKESKLNPRLQFKIKICGDSWIVRMFDSKHWPKVWNDCIGLTESIHTKKKLYINFKGPKVTKDTIAHELTHAFITYKCYSTRTPHLTVEENFCELMGKKYKFLYLLTEAIYGKFINEAKECRKR